MPKGNWALLFDLDQTLVITTALQAMRDQGQWPQIRTSLHLTQLPVNTLLFLQKVRPHFQLGIVTSSPRSYAENLVKYHNLSIPVLAAFHDTKRHKPDPAPLLYAANKLGISPSNCFHVGDHAKDIIAAHHAGMISIAISWESLIDTQKLSRYSYILCTNWKEVLTSIKQYVKAE